MKQLLFLLALVASVGSTQAQTPTWQWGRRGGGGGGLNNQAEKIINMATDKSGNVYMLAQLDGGGDATVSTSTGNYTLPNQWGGRDGVLLSYDCNGKLRWAKVFGSDGDEEATGMSMDTLGHLYVSMQTDRDFNVDIDSMVANPKSKTMGLIQYDTAGHFKWFRQPNTDSANRPKNLSQYRSYNIYTMPNGDTYWYCKLGVGLIAGTTNLVVTTAGYYFLKYNAAGVPKELIKPDMFIPNNSFFIYPNFSVTKSRKILFTGISYSSSSQPSYPVVGGQVVKGHIFLCCFSPTGSVLWRVEGNDTLGGGFIMPPLIDESKGLIYLAGGAGSDGANMHDTIQGFVVKNNPAFATPGFKRGLPMLFVADTLGIVKMVKNGYGYRSISSTINSLTFRSDGRLFAYGDGGGVLWDGLKFEGVSNTGYQSFMPSFNATTGAVVSMDSLIGSNSTFADVITADNNNNIYVGGRLSYDINIAGQNIISGGGQSDFFVAKFGTANCTIVPLKMISYTASPQPSRNGEGVKAVLNKWTTANEINVSRFTVQRSNNGKDWETVGVVMAKNASLNEYSFIDELKTKDQYPKTLYYRIESIDYDGSKQYSEVRQLAIRNEQIAISIFPNPSKDYVTINCVGMKEIKLINQLGQGVFHKTINKSAYKMDVSSLCKGVYFLSVLTTNGDVKNEKLIVQ